MNILIDIGHPAHVHYFKNFIKIMLEKGHNFLITARDKECSFDLLNKYGLPFVKRGKGGMGLLGKIFYILKADYKIFNVARNFKPDLFLSFASTYAAHVSKLYRKPHISFDDTEHSKLEIFMYAPFTDSILNPSCFQKNLGRKQIYFKGFMELCYLHPKYFAADPNIWEILGIDENEKYIILRFISWEASHDIGQGGLTCENKMELVKELSKHATIFISAERELPKELKPYKIPISPEKIHDALAYAHLYIGEGATMASESAILGTPAIYVNSLSAGTLEEQEKYGLLNRFENYQGLLEKANLLLKNPNLKEEYQVRRRKMLSEKIDVTTFMVWFIEHYPKSALIMKEKPSYQNLFL